MNQTTKCIAKNQPKDIHRFDRSPRSAKSR